MNLGTILITGAGGTVGRLLLDHYLRNMQVKKIIALERSEMAMAELQARYGNDGRVQLLLADLLDPFSYQHALQGCDAVIHCAALKHVTIGRSFPERQSYENVTAFYKLIRSAKAAGVRKFLFCSTDKAAQPTGVMGATKHLLELVCREAATPEFTTGVVRFANILGSNGSLLHIIANRRQDGGKVVLRDPRMTRYIMRAPEVTGLIDYALANMRGGEIFVYDAPSARVQDVIEATFEHLDMPSSQLEIGQEPVSENIDERLFSPEEISRVRRRSHYLVLGGSPDGEPLLEADRQKALSSASSNLSRQQIGEFLYGN